MTENEAPANGFDAEKFSQLISDIFCIADIRGLFFKTVNPAFTRILGYDLEEACSRPIMSFIHPDDRERTLAVISDELKLGKETLNFINRYQHKNGWYVWIEWRTKPVPGEGLSYAVGRDITERRRMEQELLKMQKLESIGYLAGGIAHDFNNLLMAIMGNISLSRTLISSDVKAARLLAEAEQACSAAKELSNRLLTFSRGGEPQRKPSPLDVVVRDAASMALAGARLSHSVNVPPELPLVEIDAAQIRQVLSNLLINAREAMPEGGHVEITASSEDLADYQVAPLPRGRYVRLTIRDNGVGIPEEDLQRIFDPYYSTKERGSQKGRGLGLAICHSIVTKHNGMITAQSALGKGTAFTIYLPVVAEDYLCSIRPDATVAQRPGPAREKILVMDDDERVSRIVAEMLQSMQYSVEVAADGSAAVERYENARKAGAPFDIVLLDLTVPGGMGAIDTVRRLREIEPSVVAIVSSGYVEDPIMKAFGSCGFAAAIAKPYSFEQLQKTLVQLRGHAPS